MFFVYVFVYASLLYIHGIFMYKYSNNQLPSLFQNYFELNSNIHTYPTRRSSDFHLENPRTILAQKSVRHHGPDIWNTLPCSIRQCPTLSNFKVLLKKHLLLTYNGWWNIVLVMASLRLLKFILPFLYIEIIFMKIYLKPEKGRFHF